MATRTPRTPRMVKLLGANPAQTEIPIQPVDKPILCSPYVEPDQHSRVRHQSPNFAEIPTSDSMESMT